MKKRSIIAGLCILMLNACSKFEEINVNPNNPAVVPAEMLLPQIISGAVSSMTSSGVRAGQYVQHLAWLGGTSEADGRYNLTGASYREEWNAPMRLLKDVNQLKELGTANNQPQYTAVAMVMKVYILGLMTDAYGDIPYDDAGMGNVSGKEFARFQSQQDVYRLMLADLESANQLLKGLPANTVISRDILFGGNTGRWRKFANSLKIRILMRQSAKLNVNAAVAQIFGNPTEYPVFENVADQATLVYNNNTDLYYWFIQNPPADGSGVDFNGDGRVSDVLVNMLASKNDPRLQIYTSPTKNSYNANRTNSTIPLVYRGQRAGLSAAEQTAYYTSSGFNKDDFSVIGRRIRRENRAFVMTYAELLLLKSEAIQRGIISGNVNETYLQGVRASFDKWPATASTEVHFISEAQKMQYFSRADVGLSTTEPMKQIAEQLWLDSYLNGFEGWSGWRRTGFPQIVPGPSVLARIPVRYTYSDNEQNNPMLIEWINQTMSGQMPTHNTKVWFQP
jgi:hypothetical protein